MATSANDDGLFTIQTDTVIDDTSTATDSSPTTTTDDDFGFDSTSTEPYTGTCATPLMTGNRPYWAKSGYDPYDCGSSIILLNWTTYCCNGKLIDLSQPLSGGDDFRFDNELCFENMRCCSDDPDVTQGSATSCTAGTAASMPLESSVSSEFYATASSSATSDDDPFSTITPSPGAATTSSTPSSASSLATPFSFISTLLLVVALLMRNPSS